MKESDRKGLASHPGPESCAGVGNCVGEALTGVHAGQVLSCEIKGSGVSTLLSEAEDIIAWTIWQVQRELPAVGDPDHA